MIEKNHVLSYCQNLGPELPIGVLHLKKYLDVPEI